MARLRSKSPCSLRVMWVFTLALTMLGLMGLLMKSTAPRARPYSSSVSSCWAVTKMTGMSRVSGSALSCWQTSWPLMPSMMTSSKTRSGSGLRQRASACSPLVAMKISHSSRKSWCSSLMLIA